MADDIPIVQTIPGPALSATSDTPDIKAPPPPLSATNMGGPEAEPPAPDSTETPPEEAPPAETPPAEEPPAETPPEETPPAAAREDRGVGKVLNAKDAEIARLNAEKDAVQRQLNEALIRRTEPAAPVAPPVEVKPDLKPLPPKRADFETPDAYDAAMLAHLDERDAWTVRQSKAEAKALLDADAAIRDQQANSVRVNNDFAAAQAQHEARVAKAVEKHPDFAEVAYANDVQISPSMAVLIVNSEAGPDIMYHLGKNKAEAARIAAMVMPDQFFPKGHEWAGQPVPNVAAQARAIGQLEGRLAATPANVSRETPPKQVTKAPPPPTPVRNRAAAAPKTGDEKSMDEYFNDHPLTRKRAEAASRLGITTY